MPAVESADPVCVLAGALVDKVRERDGASEEELRRLLSRGVRFLVARKLPARQVEACVGEVLDRAIQGIQSGSFDDPVRLVQGVRRQIAVRVREIQLENAAGQRRRIMQEILRGLSPRERESLLRSYVQGQDDERIGAELRMPPAESRSLRGRVRARFHEVCRQDAVREAS